MTEVFWSLCMKERNVSTFLIRFHFHYLTVLPIFVLAERYCLVSISLELLFQAFSLWFPLIFVMFANKCFGFLTVHLVQLEWLS